MNTRTVRDMDAGGMARRCRLIYFSSVPYASYVQRPHFMVKAFADNGFNEILWVDPYPTRLPALADFRRLCTFDAETGHAVDSRIQVIRPHALPVEPLPMSGIVNRYALWRSICNQLKHFGRGADYCVVGIGRPSKLADWALRHVQHERSFADILDSFPDFYRGVSRLAMHMRVCALLGKADDIYCSSSTLASKVRRKRPDATLIPNGYSTGSLPAPLDAGKRCFIGYVGAIASWFDWPLVRALAQALPDVPIRLIGPEFIPRLPNLPANIEIFGEVSQERVVSLVQEFAVGLIPFRVNTLTAGVDPIKFYEYRSLGIPVWSTAFGEMQLRDRAHGVTHISPGSNWRTLWNDARASVVDAEDVASFRLEVDWGRRFEPMFAHGTRHMQNAGRRNSYAPVFAAPVDVRRPAMRG